MLFPKALPPLRGEVAAVALAHGVTHSTVLAAWSCCHPQLDERERRRCWRDLLAVAEAAAVWQRGEEGNR